MAITSIDLESSEEEGEEEEEDNMYVYMKSGRQILDGLLSSAASAPDKEECVDQTEEAPLYVNYKEGEEQEELYSELT